jgi:hypothetical protein
VALSSRPTGRIGCWDRGAPLPLIRCERPSSGPSSISGCATATPGSSTTALRTRGTPATTNSDAERLSVVDCILSEPQGVSVGLRSRSRRAVSYRKALTAAESPVTERPRVSQQTPTARRLLAAGGYPVVTDGMRKGARRRHQDRSRRDSTAGPYALGLGARHLFGRCMPRHGCHGIGMPPRCMRT